MEGVESGKFCCSFGRSTGSFWKALSAGESFKPPGTRCPNAHWRIRAFNSDHYPSAQAPPARRIWCGQLQLSGCAVGCSMSKIIDIHAIKRCHGSWSRRSMTRTIHSSPLGCTLDPYIQWEKPVLLPGFGACPVLHARTRPNTLISSTPLAHNLRRNPLKKPAPSRDDMSSGPGSSLSREPDSKDER